MTEPMALDFSAKEVELIDTAIEAFVMAAAKSLGRPNPNQIVQAMVDVNGDVDAAKKALREEMKSERAELAGLRRSVAEIQYKLAAYAETLEPADEDELSEALDALK